VWMTTRQGHSESYNPQKSPGQEKFTIQKMKRKWGQNKGKEVTIVGMCCLFNGEEKARRKEGRRVKRGGALCTKKWIDFENQRGKKDLKKRGSARRPEGRR